MGGTITFSLSQAKPVPPPPPPPDKKPKGAVTFSLSQAKPVTDQTTPDTDTPDVAAAGPSLHDLSAQNPDKEGTYKMKDEKGGVFQVPYSNVELVDDFRNHFIDENEAKRYEKDNKAEGPTWRDKLLSHTSPLSEDKKAEIRKQYEVVPDWFKAQTKGLPDQDVAAAWKEQGEADISIRDFTLGFANGAGTLLLHPSESGKGAIEQARDMLAMLATTRKGMATHPDDPSLKDSPAVREVIREKDEFLSMVDQIMKQYKTNSPYLVGQMVGQWLLLKGSLDAVKGLPKAVEAVKTGANTGAKEMTGIRPRTAADAVEKLTEKNKTIEEENQAKREAHAKAVTETNEHNTKVAENNRKLAEIKQRIVPKTGPSRFKVIQDSAKQYFDKKYNRLSQLVGERKAPLDELVEGVENAKAEKLEGSDTKVAIFEDILKRAKGEITSSEQLPDNWHEMEPEEQGEWLKARSAEGNKISFDDLRGYYRELGKVIGSDSTAPDVKQAAISVREVLDKMQKDLADNSGLEAKKIYSEVSKEYKDYAQTMLDRTGPKASATAKALAEPDADSALKHFEKLAPSEKSRELDLLAGRGENSNWLRGVRGGEGKIEQLKTPVEVRAEAGDTSVRVGESEKLRNMRNYRLDTEKLVRQYLDSLDKREQIGKPKPLPEHPEMKEIEQMGEEDITAANRKEYMKTIDALKRRGIWYGAALPWLWVARDLLALNFSKAAINSLGAAMTSMATIAGLTKLGDFLEKPEIRDWVAQPSAAELRELDKLPPEQRKAVADGLKNIRVVAAKEGIKVSPKLVEFSKKNGGDEPPPPPKPSGEPPKTPPETPPSAPAAAPPVTPPAEPALPGMENAVAEQHGAAEDFKAEEQKKEAEASLTTPKAYISKATGEMERNSPLFRDSEASGQGGLFREKVEPARVIGKDEKGRAILDVREMKPGEVGRVRMKDLRLDPRRFQYKLSPDEKGVTNKLQGKSWDENLAGVVHAWKDPADGEVYVVNGHHRFEMAERFDVPNLDVKMIDAPDEASARAVGAMQNLADGRGTPLDAAKFLRDTGMTPEKMKNSNLNWGGESIVREGVSLATLSDEMFARVVDGDVDPKVGAAIADSAPGPKQQESLLKYIRGYEKQTGRELTPSHIRTIGERMKRSMTESKGQPAVQAGLWSEEEMQDNLLGEMAEVTDYVEKYLKTKRRILKGNATQTAASVMGEHGATFDPKAVGKAASTEASILERFKAASDKVGDVDDEIRKAAEDLHDGDLNPNEIKQDVAKRIYGILKEEHGKIAE